MATDTRVLRLNLSLDFAPFVAAMKRVAAAIGRLDRTLWGIERRHRFKHHNPEVPWRSALHAQYDVRRRARRRRGRR